MRVRFGHNYMYASAKYECCGRQVRSGSQNPHIAKDRGYVR